LPPPTVAVPAPTEKDVTGLDILEGNRIVDVAWLLQHVLNKSSGNHPGGAGCNFADNVVLRDNQAGLKSTITFRCAMCGLITKLPLTRPDSMPVNLAATMGAVTGGGGFASLAAMCSSLNMRGMSDKTYVKQERLYGEAVRRVALETMLAAGREERRLALLEGSVTADGRPTCAVMGDAIWGTRSYKTNYKSKSGTVILQ
jgi:hypothetical protein